MENIPKESLSSLILPHFKHQNRFKAENSILVHDLAENTVRLRDETVVLPPINAELDPAKTSTTVELLLNSGSGCYSFNLFSVCRLDAETKTALKINEEVYFYDSEAKSFVKEGIKLESLDLTFENSVEAFSFLSFVCLNSISKFTKFATLVQISLYMFKIALDSETLMKRIGCLTNTDFSQFETKRIFLLNCKTKKSFSSSDFPNIPTSIFPKFKNSKKVLKKAKRSIISVCSGMTDYHNTAIFLYSDPENNIQIKEIPNGAFILEVEIEEESVCFPEFGLKSSNEVINMFENTVIPVKSQIEEHVEKLFYKEACLKIVN